MTIDGRITDIWREGVPIDSPEGALWMPHSGPLRDIHDVLAERPHVPNALAMEAESVCPRPMLRSDARALIGLLSILEAHAMASQIDTAVVDHIGRRFADEGILVRGATDPQFRQALNDLNHRIRYALGEYDDPPAPMPVP